jgi:ribosomal protein S18 acetylase RimI-like enzyme
LSGNRLDIIGNQQKHPEGYIMQIEFVENSKLTEFQLDALKRLRAAVYPPEVLETLPGRFFTWASVQWSVFIWDSDELLARVGLVVRDILDNGVTKHIGGIGGVATHPARQGQGLASTAMREAAKHFNEDFNVSYALLFCRPHLVEFYKRLNWKPFQGLIYVEQPQGKIEFSANGAMLLDVKEEAPLHGVLDLNGLPW